MKKRILALVVMLALLVTALAITVYAVTVPSNVEWIEIGDADAFKAQFATSSCPHMTKDYVAGMTRYYKLTDNITIEEDSTLFYVSNKDDYNVNTYIDLNGKTLTYASPKTTGATRFMLNYNQNATLTIVNGTLVSTSALTGAHGALISSSNGANLVLEDVVINDTNDCATASNIYGKLISVTGGSLTMKRVTLTARTSNALGHALIRTTGETYMENCSFTASTTGQMSKGGILCVNGGSAELKNCTFTGGNGESGGALYAYNASVTLKGCDFTGSTSGMTTYGGIAYFQNCSTAEITDCTFTDGYAEYGGAIYSYKGNLTLNNTTVTGGKATAQGGNIMHEYNTLTLNAGTKLTGGEALHGGNLSLSNTATCYIKPGVTLTGGTAKGGNGGNLYASLVSSSTTAPVIHMTGGTVTGGQATSTDGTMVYGGNMAFFGLSGKPVTFHMSGGVLGGTPTGDATYSGYAVTGGGNIHAYYATVNISDGAEISYGHSDNYAGNLSVSTAATANITGGVIKNGVSVGHGGNIYTSSTNTVLNISGGTVSSGNAGKMGGNLYIGNGKFNLTGGVIENGVASDTGGNIQINMGYGSNANSCGAAFIGDDGDASTPIPRIINGTAKGGNGGNLLLNCQGNRDYPDTATNNLKLGNVIISGGSCYGEGQDMYVSGWANLTVLKEFAQTLKITVHEDQLPSPLYGNPLNTARIAAEGAFPGTLILDGYGEPRLYGTAEDTYLYVAAAAVIDANGNRQWFATNSDAVAAYSADSRYLQAGSGELVLNGDCIVDIAGQAVAITGTGNVTCFDSANDDYKTFGTATVNGPVLVNTGFAQVNGANYYTLSEEGTYSFHRLEMKITTASLRPSIGGIYYTGRWSCDDTMKAHIGGFGVAASIVSMPESDFADLENPTSKWTVFTAAEFESGITKTGVMISGILKDAEDNATQDRINKNAEYGQKKIYAVAYLTVDGVNYTGTGLSYSLYDILKIVSDNIEQYSQNAETLQSFMAHWSANGLVGEPWDSLDFDVSEDIVRLNALYAGTSAYYGELHEHAATGGTSDGNQPLSVWKEGMEKLNMDFAAILDHRQSLHMYLDAWDNSMFIGGSEAAATIRDRTGVRLHYSMIFSDPAGLEAVVSQFPEFNWREWTETDREGCGGQMHFDYPAFTAAKFTEVVNAVYDNGGFMTIVHPKSEGYVDSDNPLDAWFRDGTGVEVIYTYHSNRDGWETKANYKLWTDLLAAGKKVYATAGNDEHSTPTDKAVSVIYSTDRGADAWVDQLRTGTFVAGGVGIRMAVGETVMGGETAFADNRLMVCVGDFHESLYNEDHTFRMDIYTEKGVVESKEFSCADDFYFAMDADETAMFYRVEIVDVTMDSTISYGNPIWNKDK